MRKFAVQYSRKVNYNILLPVLVHRELVKLVTRGTLIEPLHNEANYLLSIATSPSSMVGLAWTDISTSELKVRVLFM